MDTLPTLSHSVAAGIAWVYLITNFARVFTYLPQIACVWRSRDGAQAISLFTWYSWVASHLASMAYGVLVLHDAYFVAISTINFAGCAAVASIAAHRRRRFKAGSRAGAHEAPSNSPAAAPRAKQTAPSTVDVPNTTNTRLRAMNTGWSARSRAFRLSWRPRERRRVPPTNDEGVAS